MDVNDWVWFQTAGDEVDEVERIERYNLMRCRLVVGSRLWIGLLWPRSRLPCRDSFKSWRWSGEAGRENIPEYQSVGFT
jgi:hypothetical protein